MRALSFLFAALLGIALAMIAPVLAGPRPEAPQAPMSATKIFAEPAVPAESPVEAAALEPAPGCACSPNRSTTTTCRASS
jgi:hypothetical protein